MEEDDSPPINPNFFHVQLVNASDGDYKTLKEIFKVESGDMETVIVFNEHGEEKAKILVTGGKGSGQSSAFNDEFSDELK